MQTTLRSLTVLTPALAALGALSQSASAAQSPQNLYAQELYANLQMAVCSNNWDDALQAISPLIGAAELSADYRQQLVAYRHQIEGMRAAQATYSNLSGCQSEPEPIWSERSPASRTLVFSANNPDDISTQQRYAALQGSVCSNDWNEALRVIGPLMGSPSISSQYRSNLVTFRRQLETWRASSARFDTVPGCGAIASTQSQLDRTYAVE